MRYDKLVRDLIPEHIAKRGGNSVTHVATQEEYRQKLAEKLVEEAQEFLKDQNTEEIADVLEVIDAIMGCYGFDQAEIESVKQKKAQEKGKFEKKIILEEA